MTKNDKGNYNTTEEVICYRFTRLPFSLTCCPFLLSASVREVANRDKDSFPTAAALVERSTFMDDFVAGEDNTGVTTIYYQLSALMRKFSFPMGKWACNFENLRNIRRVCGLEIRSMSQILGVSWDTMRDTLFMDHRDVADEAQEGPTTKRQLFKKLQGFATQ